MAVLSASRLAYQGWTTRIMLDPAEWDEFPTGAITAGITMSFGDPHTPPMMKKIALT